jgi:hypothetical protein
MVKFAKHLELQLVPEWRDAYVGLLPCPIASDWVFQLASARVLVSSQSYVDLSFQKQLLKVPPMPSNDQNCCKLESFGWGTFWFSKEACS